MLARLQITGGDGIVFVNPFLVQDLTEGSNDEETQITFANGSELEVKGDIKTVAYKLNNEAERMLKKLGIGSVENLTIN